MGIAVRVWQRPPELPVVAEAFRRLVAVGVRRPLDGTGRARARCDGARWSGRGRPVAGRAGTPPVGSSGGSRESGISRTRPRGTTRSGLGRAGTVAGSCSGRPAG